MKTLGWIVAVSAFCANGIAWAADADSAQPVPVVESRDAAPDDNRPATLGDIRHTDAKISELRMETRTQGRELRAETQAQGQELREQIQQLQAQNRDFYATLNNTLMAMLGILAAAMTALVAMLWKSRFGNSPAPPASSAPVVALLIMAGFGVALTLGVIVSAVA